MIDEVESVIATHPTSLRYCSPVSSTKVGTDTARGSDRIATVTKKELVAFCSAHLDKIVLR
jgi:hypothetical protein